MIAGLTALIVVVGALQYRSLERASVADSEKAKARVKDQAERFAADLNREIQGAYFNFQVDKRSWEANDATDFNQRYDFWKSNTQYPELISGFTYFWTDPAKRSLHYDLERRSFVEVEMDDNVTHWREMVADPATFNPIDIDRSTLLLPIHSTANAGPNMVVQRGTVDERVRIAIPERIGYLAIKLDETVIKDRLIADLTTKYFGDGEFISGIRDRNGQIVSGVLPGDHSPDISVPLLSVAPDSLFFFSNREILPTIGLKPTVERSEGVVVNSRVESRSFTREMPANGTRRMTIELNGTSSAPKTSVFSTMTDGTQPDPNWTLAVTHREGSIDIATASALRRELLVGLGLLSLIIGAVAAIIISAMRSRRLAQRQLDFVSSVSHEFRTPLAVIYSAGENLADGVAKDSEQIGRYGELIRNEGRKLSGMVEQILGFAGARSGKRQYSFAPHNVATLIATAVEECKPLANEKGIVVDVDVSDDDLLIYADGAAIDTAIRNLLANSFKYSNGSPSIKITATRTNDRISISVEDNGIGISKADLKHVFEPFYRSSDVVDAQIHGNGLGLSIVKQIVDAHRGSIDVASQPGIGSTFTIELPTGN